MRSDCSLAQIGLSSVGLLLLLYDEVSLFN